MGKSGSRKNVIFVGLMLGMLVAAVSQTIVSPAMPVIVSELGGIEHYSWIATSALLASAVTVPVVGKLSDIYGRRSLASSLTVVDPQSVLQPDWYKAVRSGQAPLLEVLKTRYIRAISGRTRRDWNALKQIRSWSRSARFESARRLSQIGLYKPDTRSEEAPGDLPGASLHHPYITEVGVN